ncbi:uncharacterized protein EKO05_0007395 [Ascochyta rabiei]|uniref:Uncharacterized protein n=1 Tax=Didymella rabiei TaxID=5454 RepID=A0A163HB36_DIDRA|nr:uncharacterized protein EKO05_0007395 [Ascochyta rabiei]KZM25223.1 hypothetical protein ST47_g3637 [Ascochyta rabiei]UPX17018.1 hypothetical protein EKO05_0007395 [Ascochyta rabiei]
MVAGVDMSDKNAWDDSFLQDSWNDAVAEYEKYHSIAKSGKRLEDVLTEEELKKLREDHGDLIGEAEATPQAVAEANGNSDQMDTEDSMQETEEVEKLAQTKLQQETAASEEQNQPQSANMGTTAPHDTAFAASMPQAILGTVQDENLKNIMMSWYYAGYYTGLHAGQQLPRDAPPKQ